MARRIKKARIDFISLCPKGANTFRTMYKADGINADFELSLLKAKDSVEEKGELLAVVYAPEVMDSQGDIASKEVIKEAMHSAAKNGLKLDIRHDGKEVSKDDAYIAESFEIIKGDDRFAGVKDYNGKEVDVTGGWGILVKIQNDDLRKLYKENGWQGVSMGGVMQVEPLEKESNEIIILLKKIGAALVGSKPEPKGESDMTKEEVTALVKEILAEAQKAQKPDEPVKDEAKKDDAFDATNPEQVGKYLFNLRKQQLAQDVDWKDVASVAQYYTALVDLEKEQPVSKSQSTKPSHSHAPATRDFQTSMSKEIDEINAEIKLMQECKPSLKIT